ncbi:hypothetical protein D3C81_1730770 [compost metagenome]
MAFLHILQTGKQSDRQPDSGITQQRLGKNLQGFAACGQHDGAFQLLGPAGSLFIGRHNQQPGMLLILKAAPLIAQIRQSQRSSGPHRMSMRLLGKRMAGINNGGAAQLT